VSALAETPAELIVSGAMIHTFDPDHRTVEALGIADGLVVDAGALESVTRNAGPRADRLVIEAEAILPGFCDTHMHFEKVATELDMLQLTDLHSVAEILELIRSATQETAPGEWIQSFGDDNAWHEHQLAEKRLPTRAELDAAAPDHPVYLYRGWDAAALNSLASDALSGVLAAEPGWDSEGGHLHSRLARSLQEELPAATNEPEVLERASQKLLAFGITSIVDPGLPARFDETWRLYEKTKARLQVPQRLYLMDRLDHRAPFSAELRRVQTSDLDRRLDSTTQHAWGLKLLLDGEFDNAWMADGQPQRAAPTKRYTTDEIETALRLCAQRQWPICFHVMGGGAIGAAIDSVRRVGGATTFRRNQVTLAHAFLPSEQNIRDCAELGIGISVQPLLAYVFENEMLEAWGEVANQANPYRSMIELGADVAGGSDVLPCEPIRGAAVAVTRRSRLGSTFGVEQALSPQEALSLFTGRAGTYVQHPQLGTLGVGAPADFTAWPRNPLELAAENWSLLRPTLTAIGGTTVWSDDQQAVQLTPGKGNAPQ